MGPTIPGTLGGNPESRDDRFTLHCGDMRAVLRHCAADKVDAVLCDPPYDLLQASRRGSGRSNNPDTPAGRYGNRAGGFMGLAWDASGVAFDPATWREVLRVLRPGGFLASFGGTRTFHRMICAIEDAGFEIVTCLVWLYATGMPKHRAALKPAWEPIALARKPLSERSVAANVARWGTGALNVEACRIGTTKHVPASVSRTPGRALKGSVDGSLRHETSGEAGHNPNPGRRPANVLFDEAAAALLDIQSGASKSRRGKSRHAQKPGDGYGMTHTGAEYDDAGGASRFFYIAKPTSREKDAGLDGKNLHPTVKPLTLLHYLARMIMPFSDGIILDPFMGSGTTGCAAALEGHRFLGIDLSPEYVEIARRRIAHWQRVAKDPAGQGPGQAAGINQE